MATYVVKLPDVGEGIAEAELVEWHVAVGDTVAEDQPLADVMTDKATVELPTPVAGTIIKLAGEAGDVVAIGSDLVWIETESDASEAADPSDAAEPVVDTTADVAPDPVVVTSEPPPSEPAPQPESEPPRSPSVLARPLAAPAVRHRATALGVDLASVAGTGPGGRVNHEDLDRHIAGRGKATLATAPSAPGTDDVEMVKVVGLRRNIAKRMQESSRRIAHFTYVEEVDVTDLERLRAELNGRYEGERQRLSLLPFLMRAMVIAVGEFPLMNARFIDDDGVIERHRAVHLGIATQTPKGLMVPVLHHAETGDLWTFAADVSRLSAEARDGTISLQELHGSTITITSLGALGGIVTTPVINHPEVAVVGVNKIVTRPRWSDGAWVPRSMMNLSSSFDHRVVDGWDAAQFIQRIRTFLENPALLFIP